MAVFKCFKFLRQFFKQDAIEVILFVYGNIQTEITVVPSVWPTGTFQGEMPQSLPTGIYENVTWCKSPGNSHASNFKLVQTSCWYFGLFGYKQRDIMKQRFDKYIVLLGKLEITSEKQLFTSAFS